MGCEIEGLNGLPDESQSPSALEPSGGPSLEPGVKFSRIRGQTLVAQVEPEAGGVVVARTQSDVGVLAPDDRPVLFVSVGVGDQSIECEVPAVKLAHSPRPPQSCLGACRPNRLCAFPRSARRGQSGDDRSGSVRQTEEDEDGTVQSDKIIVGDPTETITKVDTWHRRDLVDHDVTGLIDACRRGGFDRNSRQRRFDWVGRERADCDRRRCVEPIVLNDDHRPGLACVDASRSRDMNIAAPHSADSTSVPQSTEIASTKA